MTIRLYDSHAQALRDFTPVTPGEVGIYVCGPTVQSAPHIGHLRSALVFDLWRRWFEHRDYRVTLVRNVTDIDDKILVNAAATEGTDQREEWWALAYRVEQDFNAAYEALGIRRPTYEPRATASVPEMIALIERLIEAGYAYPATDARGDVYFDTAAWSAYGALTRQKPAEMADAGDADLGGKRQAQDFALWKAHKDGEPETASWRTPAAWGGTGRGRPGWHIECSAMATKYLGSEFDIHGGGLDLRFPHHENELAQSHAAGDPFARYWLHNGLVNVAGTKMSKSLGNSLYAAELLGAARPLVVRYFFAQAHYRSTLEYHEGSLAEAGAAFERIEGFVERAARYLGTAPAEAARAVPEAFGAAMDDDLGTPQAVAVLHETVRAGNIALEAQDAASVEQALGEVYTMLAVLGLLPNAEQEAEGAAAAVREALGVLVEGLLEQRRAARAEKDFAAADRIRDHLAAAGVTVEDSADGSQWRIG